MAQGSRTPQSGGGCSPTCGGFRPPLASSPLRQQAGPWSPPGANYGPPLSPISSAPRFCPGAAGPSRSPRSGIPRRLSMSIKIPASKSSLNISLDMSGLMDLGSSREMSPLYTTHRRRPIPYQPTSSSGRTKACCQQRPVTAPVGGARRRVQLDSQERQAFLNFSDSSSCSGSSPARRPAPAAPAFAPSFGPSFGPGPGPGPGPAPSPCSPSTPGTPPPRRLQMAPGERAALLDFSAVSASSPRTPRPAGRGYASPPPLVPRCPSAARAQSPPPPMSPAGAAAMSPHSDCPSCSASRTPPRRLEISDAEREQLLGDLSPIGGPCPSSRPAHPRARG